MHMRLRIIPILFALLACCLARAADIPATSGDFAQKYNAANAGDVVVLSGEARPGTLALRNGVGVRGGTISGATLTGTSTGKFDHVTFDGTAFAPSGEGPLVMDLCTAMHFSGLPNPGAGQFIRSSTHGNGWISSGTSITNCTFDDPKGWAIGAWYFKNTTIKSNIFRCWNGIKADAFKDFHTDTVIEQNLFEGIGRMYLEIQGRSKRLKILYNYTRNDVFPGGANFAGNTSCLGFSAITHGDGNEGNEFIGNTVEGVFNPPDGTGTRLVLESGNGWLAEYNIGGVGGRKLGTFNSSFIGDSSGPKPEAAIGHSYIRNNRIPGCQFGQGGSYGQYPQNAHYENNGPNVTFPAAMSFVGTVPGPGKDITSGSPPPPPPLLSVTVTAQPDGSLKANWTSVAGTSSYEVATKTSDGADDYRSLGTVTGNEAVIDAGHAGWEYSVRVTGGGASAIGKARVAGDPQSAGEANATKIRSGTTKPTTDPVVEVKTTDHTLIKRIIVDGTPVDIVFHFKVTAAGDRKVQMVD
jgi:hypothetical protein